MGKQSATHHGIVIVDTNAQRGEKAQELLEVYTRNNHPGYAHESLLVRATDLVTDLLHHIDIMSPDEPLTESSIDLLFRHAKGMYLEEKAEDD